MKKTTCRAMGGSCDAEIPGDSVKAWGEAGWRHVKEMAEKGDAGHQELLKKMESHGEEEKKQWEAKMQSEFDAAPEA